MKKFSDMTSMEQSVIQEALTEYKVMLRTIKSPNGPDKTLTEYTFLASGISDKRRERYLTTVALLDAIRQ
jgi:hypothetical protein